MVNPGFDVELVEQWAATENEYAVLSTYVQDIADIGKNINDRHEGTVQALKVTHTRIKPAWRPVVH